MGEPFEQLDELLFTLGALGAGVNSSSAARAGQPTILATALQRGRRLGKEGVMVLKAPVLAKKSYKVRYTSDVTSAGTSLLIVGWVPKHGRSVPAPDEREVAPGSAQEIAATVPAFEDARRIEIRVDVPDGTGSGKLELLIDEKLHSVGMLSADTIWTSLVDK